MDDPLKARTSFVLAIIVITLIVCAIFAAGKNNKNPIKPLPSRDRINILAFGELIDGKTTRLVKEDLQINEKIEALTVQISQLQDQVVELQAQNASLVELSDNYQVRFEETERFFVDLNSIIIEYYQGISSRIVDIEKELKEFKTRERSIITKYYYCVPPCPQYRGCN